MIPAPAPSPSLSLQTYLQILRRQRRLILLVTMLTALFATLPALLDDPVYRSSARIQVSALDQQGVFGEDTSPNLPTDRARELLTEIEILRSDPIRDEVLARFLDDPPEFEDPEVEQVNFSEVVEITITASEPQVAADVANAYAEVFVEDRRERSVEALLAKAEELRDQGADAAAELDAVTAQLSDPGLAPGESTMLQLRQTTLAAQVQEFGRRADELAVEASLRGGATQVISPAVVDTTPISSSVLQSGLIGLTLGILLALTIAVVVDTAQDRLGSREDLAAVRPDVPVLAAVPQTEFTPARPQGGYAAQEAYRYLRTGVRVFGLNATLRSVLVTSAVGEEGKTTTAANLALAMADAGDRVALLDCDLRRAGLHAWFGVPNDVGLSSVVVGDATLDDAIHFVRPNLAVVTAGPIVHNPTEMLGSEQFAAVLAAIVDQADFTILDSPPVLPVADALIAGQHVDGVVAVSRIGAVRRRSVRELLHRLAEAQIPIIGLVANGTTDESPHAYYGAESSAPARASAASR